MVMRQRHDYNVVPKREWVQFKVSVWKMRTRYLCKGVAPQVWWSVSTPESEMTLMPGPQR